MFNSTERMIATRYLRAKRKEGFYFRHQRFFIGRDRAWRCNADYRDVGNERFSR